MTNQTLYLKIDQNVQVHDTHVTLGDIAQVSCSAKEVENKVKTLKIPNATNGNPGRHTMSVMEVLDVIQKEYPNLEISNLGETDFIITYEKAKQPAKALQWCKTLGVCFIAFFGAAFTIMAFNNDAGITKLFAQIFLQFTGRESDGFTILEIAYSIGIGLGILLYFNHFAGRKLTADPTPMEIEMRSYEDDVNTTLLEAGSRKPKAKG